MPRYSLYLESETEGDFIVRAAISKWHGEAWPKLDTPSEAPPVQFTINLVSNNDVLATDNITVGTEAKVVSFDLTGLEPRFEPYEVVLSSTASDGEPAVKTTSEFMYLPEKESGSVTKLDNWKGGMVFRNSKTDGKFEPLLPYGFYASCDNFLCENNSISAIQEYWDLGLNGMVPLTTIWDSQPEFEFMDKLGLKYMYDLRDYYQNLTETGAQVTAIKDFDALYAYWGTDEPDGWQHPFEAQVLSHQLIRSIDPYHPVSVTLNCQNYYFDRYTEGADFIMEDAYPIGINSTFSKWGTPCNATYGDCGCDNCEGSVQDVPSRLDDLSRYEAWLGRWPKTKAHNPQSFYGEGYWLREPTADEAVVMNALAFNHGAKAIVSWVWPTSDNLAGIHGRFASLVTASPVLDFVAGEAAQKVPVADLDLVDVAFWGKDGEILLSVVNGGYELVDGPVKVTLPEGVVPKAVKSNAWGEMSWELLADGIQAQDLKPMTAYMVFLET